MTLTAAQGEGLAFAAPEHAAAVDEAQALDRCGAEAARVAVRWACGLVRLTGLVAALAPGDYVVRLLAGGEAVLTITLIIKSKQCV